MAEIGIPCIYGLDQNHGTTYTLGGTLFPQNINMGAAFNPDLTYEAARVTAYETRAAIVPGHTPPLSIWHVIPVGHVYGKIMEKTV